MRNHDPARKMKEQEWKDTQERKRKLQRGERKVVQYWASCSDLCVCCTGAWTSRNRKCMCGNWLGLVECDSTRSGSQRSGIFHAVCVAAVAPTGRVDGPDRARALPRDSARAAPRRTAVAAMRPRRGPETAPRPVTFPPGDAKQPTNRGQPDGDRR